MNLIKLPIYYKSEKNDMFEDIGIAIDIKDYNISDMYFSRIDAIGEYNDETGCIGTEVIVCGESYFSSYSSDQVLKEIKRSEHWLLFSIAEKTKELYNKSVKLLKGVKKWIRKS